MSREVHRSKDLTERLRLEATESRQVDPLIPILEDLATSVVGRVLQHVGVLDVHFYHGCC